MYDAVVIIPALDHDERLTELVTELREYFENIIIIDDGSASENQHWFAEIESLGCSVIHHEKNLGKGAALKTGIAAAIEKHGSLTVITADSDGQHLAEDIAKVAEESLNFPDSLILGERDLKRGNVPLRSKIGNSFSSLFFLLTNGIRCPDTQTGLRAIPPGLHTLALSEDGVRYDFEMNFLSDAVRTAELRFVPITTVYTDRNSGSHFRTVSDALRVHGRFFRYVCASLAGALTDLLLFAVLSAVLPIPSVVSKIIVDTMLFFISFIIQKNWVFRK